MNTFLKAEKTEDTQKIAAFSGEGAYHGSSKVKPAESAKTTYSEVIEVLPVSLFGYLKMNNSEFTEFPATFSNSAEIKKILPIPSQDDIKNDQVTFCWCPIQDAIKEAGPLTKSVLQEMEEFLEGKKKFVYIDSKIQYFKVGDLPVDSKLWHVDGSIAIRDQRAEALGHTLLHDMRARLAGPAIPPRYLAYQSSYHCATEFANGSVTINLPDLIPSFDILDQRLQNEMLISSFQPAGSIVSFDGKSLHRARPATDEGWRLWIRCVETDKEVNLTSSIVSCYGTVFRPNL